MIYSPSLIHSLTTLPRRMRARGLFVVPFFIPHLSVFIFLFVVFHYLLSLAFLHGSRFSSCMYFTKTNGRRRCFISIILCGAFCSMFNHLLVIVCSVFIPLLHLMGHAALTRLPRRMRVRALFFIPFFVPH